MREEDLKRLLAELPRAEASPDFTENVLRRLDERGARRLSPPRRWAWAAMGLAAAATIASLAAWQLEKGRERARDLAQIELLKSEHEALSKELAGMRELAAPAEGEVFLGRAGDVDLVWRAESAKKGPIRGEMVRPAVFRAPLQPDI